MRFPVTSRPLLASMVALLALTICTARAHATPATDLAAARDAFRRGDYDAALPGLNYLLYPTPRLAQTGDLIEAHVLLGVCLVATNDSNAATREFEAALFLSPDLSLDPVLFSSDAVRAFNETKVSVAARAKQEAASRALADERDRLRRYRESLIVYEVRPYYVNFIPFGAGQFQNGARAKGIFFSATEVTAGALSAGIWLYLVNQYGYNGRVPTADAHGVRTLQEVEIGAGAVCLGVMAWGVIDSLIHYKPRAQIEGDDSLLPPDLRPRKQRESMLDRIQIAPLIGGGQTGVAMSLTY